jgi:hypothetical protein
MQREGAVQMRRVRRVDRERPAQRRIRGVRVRHDDVQAIGRATLDHEHEAAVGRDMRERDLRRHEQRARTGSGDAQKLAA